MSKSKQANESVDLKDRLLTGGLTEQEVSKFLETIKERVGSPRVIVFMGKTGVGKSEACNALFGGGKEFKTNAVCSETSKLQLETIPGLPLTLVDVPGVGEPDMKRNEQWQTLYQSVLTKGVSVTNSDGKTTYLPVDVIVWLVKADDRSLQVDAEFYRNVFKKYCPPEMMGRVVYAISMADKIDPIRGHGGWQEDSSKPGAEQEKNLDIKKREVGRIFEKPAHQIVAFSASTSFNIDQLLEQVVDTLPREAIPLVVAEARKNQAKTKKRIINKKVEKKEDNALWDVAEDVADFIAGDKGKKVVKVIRTVCSRAIEFFKGWWS